MCDGCYHALAKRSCVPDFLLLQDLSSLIQHKPKLYISCCKFDYARSCSLAATGGIFVDSAGALQSIAVEVAAPCHRMPRPARTVHQRGLACQAAELTLKDWYALAFGSPTPYGCLPPPGYLAGPLPSKSTLGISEQVPERDLLVCMS